MVAATASGAKLTTVRKKNMCDDPAYIAYLRQVFQISAECA